MVVLRALAKDPKLWGRITVEVKLDPSGEICSVATPVSDPAMKDVSACARDAFEKHGKFPAPNGGCLFARVPMVFVPHGADAGAP